MYIDKILSRTTACDSKDRHLFHKWHRLLSISILPSRTTVRLGWGDVSALTLPNGDICKVAAALTVLTDGLPPAYTLLQAHKQCRILSSRKTERKEAICLLSGFEKFLLLLTNFSPPQFNFLGALKSSSWILKYATLHFSWSNAGDGLSVFRWQAWPPLPLMVRGLRSCRFSC